MPKKLKQQISASAIQSSNALPSSVTHLLQSSNDRKSKIISLKQHLRSLRDNHYQNLKNLEGKFTEILEETVKDIDELKASIAEEKYTQSTLQSNTKPKKENIDHLKQEIQKYSNELDSLSNQLVHIEDQRDKIKNESSIVKKERQELMQDFSTYKEAIQETKKQRHSLESEKEGVKYLYETQNEKLKEVQFKLQNLQKDKMESTKIESNELKHISSDLDRKYGRQRIEKESKFIKEKLEQKLSNIIESAKNFNKEQIKEYNDKIHSVREASNRVQEKSTKTVNNAKEREKDLEYLQKSNVKLEKEIEKIQLSFKKEDMQKDVILKQCKSSLEKVKNLIDDYIMFTERFELQTKDKLEILKSLNEAKEILKEEQYLRVEDSAITDFETEGENESMMLEDRILSKNLFNEIIDDLTSKNLKIEGYVYAKRIDIRNIGAEPLKIEKGEIRIVFKRGKEEFRIEEDLELESGQKISIFGSDEDKYLGMKNGYQNKEDVKMACVWKREKSKEIPFDEIMLVKGNEAIHKSVYVNGEFLVGLLGVIMGDGEEGKMLKKKACKMF